jgi:7,8-dihydropterin-6-yl-methyl-4-(beta-D-ribofuranosyl)aminobenzene 5'-phosphate synthase
MARIMILYDNRTGRDDLRSGWGFAAVVEQVGRTVLFDTGGDKLVLEHNADVLGVDLASTDALVLSHEHCDHIGAVTSALHKNLDVFYPASFSTLFQGEVSEEAGWRPHPVSESVEVVPGVQSTGELGDRIKEQGLIVTGDRGSVLVTGCAHPGIVTMVRAAARLTEKPIYLAIGGFHLRGKTDSEVEAIALELKGMGVVRIGPCHCTGERAMAVLKEAFASSYVEVTVGSEVEV